MKKPQQKNTGAGAAADAAVAHDPAGAGGATAPVTNAPRAKPDDAGVAEGAATPGKGVISVRAKSERGRWRAGRHFTREATLVPVNELNDEQREALERDPELVIVT